MADNNQNNNQDNDTNDSVKPVTEGNENPYGTRLSPNPDEVDEQDDTTLDEDDVEDTDLGGTVDQDDVVDDDGRSRTPGSPGHPGIDDDTG